MHYARVWRSLYHSPEGSSCCDGLGSTGADFVPDAFIPFYPYRVCEQPRATATANRSRHQPCVGRTSRRHQLLLFAPFLNVHPFPGQAYLYGMTWPEFNCMGYRQNEPSVHAIRHGAPSAGHRRSQFPVSLRSPVQ